jgi:voltage-gated potassium channel Kch
MDLFGLTADRVMARIRQDEKSHSIPSLSRSILIGSLGFCFASLCVFATVAFAERWMYQNLGLSGAYIVWTALFIFLGGALLSPLVIGPGRLWRFQFLFGLTFLLYAVGWVGSYFTLRGFTGELAGSITGSILMAIVISLAFGVIKTLFAQAAALFIANSAGYFLGGAIHHSIHGKLGMLLWGVIYGLFLGAGLGLSLFLAQAQLRNRLDNLKPH